MLGESLNLDGSDGPVPGKGRLTTYAVCGCSSGAVEQADSVVWLPLLVYQNRLLSTTETDGFLAVTRLRCASDKTSNELQRRCFGDR